MSEKSILQKKYLSIVIPHYNSPVMLDNLIRSIPDKDEIQIIVVDDNSNQELEELAKVKNKYSLRVEFYTNDSGIQSAGSCRNIGMKYAQGEWILFADADDYYLPGMYEIVQKYFESEYDMVVFTPTSVVSGTEQISNRHLHMVKVIDEFLRNPSRENYLAMSAFEISVPWSKLIRKSVIEENQISFNQSLFGNDIVFSAKIGYFCKKVTASYEQIYCVTRHSGSLTTQISEEAYDIRLNEYMQKCVFLREKYGDKLCNHLHLTGAGFLYTAILQKYGVHKYFEIIKKFHKNNVPVITLKEYTPMHIVRKLYHRKQQKKVDKQYYVYKKNAEKIV